MRKSLTLAVLATVAGLSMTSAYASPNVCLTTYQIDRTKVVDDNTIIFYMKNGTAWQNTMRHKCNGLKFANGFSYSPANDQVCSNLEIIKLVDSGTTCGLGEFTPFTPPQSGPLSN